LAFLLINFSAYFYFTAILSTIMVLIVKVIALFAHGPELKKLSAQMTSSESQYESSLQLMLVLVISFTTGEFTLSSVSSLLSSVVMIGKSGAESYLTFGRENLLEQTGPGWRGLLNKIKLLAVYSPVFIATTSARLTALAVELTYTPSFATALLLPSSLAVPSMLVLLTKICALKDLSVVDLVKGLLGEQTTHSLWGGRGREGSKKLQLFMQVYLLLLHSICMVLVLLDWISIIDPREARRGGEERQDSVVRLQIGAVVSLATAWLLSLPLFIVLYRNTATSPQAEDKGVGGKGDDNGNVDGDGDRDGCGDEKQEEGDAKDKREYGEV